MLLSVLVNDSAKPTCTKQVHMLSPEPVAVKEVSHGLRAAAGDARLRGKLAAMTFLHNHVM